MNQLPATLRVPAAGIIGLIHINSLWDDKTDLSRHIAISFVSELFQVPAPLITAAPQIRLVIVFPAEVIWWSQVRLQDRHDAAKKANYWPLKLIFRRKWICD